MKGRFWACAYCQQHLTLSRERVLKVEAWNMSKPLLFKSQVLWNNSQAIIY